MLDGIGYDLFRENGEFVGISHVGRTEREIVVVRIVRMKAKAEGEAAFIIHVPSSRPLLVQLRPNGSIQLPHPITRPPFLLAGFLFRLAYVVTSYDA
jgi:hypothetical protein